MAKQVTKPQPVVNPCCINQTVKTFLLAPETSAPVSGDFILMEDGVSFILMEDGSKILLE